GTTSDGKTILKPETFQQLFTPANLRIVTDYSPVFGIGLGAFITTYKGETVIQHGGNVQGGVSKTCFFPDRKFGVVSLYTGADFGTLNFCYDIADRLLFKDSKTLKKSMAYATKLKDVTAKQRKALQDEFNGRNKDTKPSFDTVTSLGEYSNPVLGSVMLEKSILPGSVFQIDLKAPLAPTFPLVHFEHDRFVVPIEIGQNITVTFKIDANKVKGFVLQGDGVADDIPNGLYFTKL
ncbi:hypothetical protein BC833DRAFT_570343, partial [Globomyces pollinis-pini]